MILEVAANTVNMVIFIVVNGILVHMVSSLLGFVERHVTTSFFISFIAGFVGIALNLILLFAAPAFVQSSMIAMFFAINAVVFIYLIKRMCGVSYIHSIVAWVIIAVMDLAIGFVIGVLLTVTVPATIMYWVPFVGLTCFTVFGIWFAVHTVKRRKAVAPF